MKTTTNNPNSSIETQQPPLLGQMETVLEVLNEGVIITDHLHQIVFANSSFMEMTGFSRQELIGFETSRFYSPRERDLMRQQSEVKFREGHNRYSFVLPRKDGSRVPVVINSRAFTNFEARFGVMTFTDISQHVRVEEQLRSANAKLLERQTEIEEDLRLAGRVQKSLAPKSQVWDKVSIDAFYHPANSIGGDFALVNSHDCGQVSLLLCDVSGHGIGSALVANRIYSETEALLRGAASLLEIFGELNRFLIEDIASSGMFVTAAAARINAQQRRMVFAGAGHPPAILARPGQSPVLLESRCMILGAFSDAVQATNSVEVELEPDDRIIFYTDGITEAFDSRGEMLGTQGVQEIIRQASSLPAARMKQGILDGVAAWRHGPQTDDVSLVLAHIR